MKQERKVHLSVSEKCNLLKTTSGLTDSEAVDFAEMIDHFTFLQLRTLIKVIRRIEKGN